MPNSAAFRCAQRSIRSIRKRALRTIRLLRRYNLQHGPTLFFIVSLFSISTLCIILFFSSSSHGKSPVAKFRHPLESPISRTEELAQEAVLARHHVCSRAPMRENVEALHLCNRFLKRASGKKIVGIVEVRNVQHSIRPFLTSLSQVVDSIVIIDDLSSDSTRNHILTHRHVEVMLNKSGVWVREELYDRQVLLRKAREVGGTHFILLDYDEFISANCVTDGSIHRRILALNPGESLYLQWVQPWKTTTMQRVLPKDPSMNFLTRRQTVIFADDGKFEYTERNAIARRIGAEVGMKNSTIHVLRCPRSICPKLPRHKGPKWRVRMPVGVKTMPECRLIELRFININNVLLKSAWYEALGNVLGAREGVTSGKMIRRMFPTEPTSGVGAKRRDTIALMRTDKSWLHGYSGVDEGVYDRVETWRAEEILQWVHTYGASRIANKGVMSLIDVNGLQTAVDQAKHVQNGVLYHVPRRKTARVIVVIEHPFLQLGSSYLRFLGLAEVRLTTRLGRHTVDGVRLFDKDGGKALLYEDWKSSVEDDIQKAITMSSSKAVYLACSKRSEAFSLALLDLMRTEFCSFHITYLFADWIAGSKATALFKRAVQYSMEAGSHIHILDIPPQSFGAYAALHWLRDRVMTEKEGNNKSNSVQDLSIVEFAEDAHRRYDGRMHNIIGGRLLPVAKLLFSLNVGRSGSKYIADILASVNNVILAVHEPQCPKGLCSSGGAKRMQNTLLSSSYAERKRLKLGMIRSEIASIPHRTDKKLFTMKTVECSLLEQDRMDTEFSGRQIEMYRGVYEANSRTGCSIIKIDDVIYAETNPNFKSWIYDVVLDSLPAAGYDMKVMVIRKYVSAILKSLYETGYFSIRDGYNWMETCASVNSKVKIAGLLNDSKLDAFEKVLSYIVNSEAVFRHVMRTYDGSGVTFLQLRAEEIYSRQGTLNLVRELDLWKSEQTEMLAGVVSDKYEMEGSKGRRTKVSLVECEERVKRFIEKFSNGDHANLLKDLVSSMGSIDGFEYHK